MEHSPEALVQLTQHEGSRCEECWVLVGERRGNIWLSRLLDRIVGKPATVEFDGPAVLAREEQLGDILGFLHTHPDCQANLSQRDINTMQAWTSAFGKPLLCLIEGTNGLRAYLFENSDSPGTSIRVERFQDDWLVAIDS